jgi:methyl-accepting chemotaxis protein
MRLANIKIAHKLALGFATVLSLLLLIAGIMYFRIQEVGAHIGQVVDSRYPKIHKLQEIEDRLNHSTIELGNMALLAEPAVRQAAEQRIAADSAIIGKALEYLDSNIKQQASRDALAQLTARRADFKQQTALYLKLLDAGQQERAIAQLQDGVQESRQRYAAALDQLVTVQESLMHQDGAGALDLARQSGPMLAVLAATALLLGAALAWWITRSITVPLDAAVANARRVAAGDLTLQLAATSRDETGQLLQALADMTASLRGIVGQVHSGSEQIASAAGEIAAGNLDLSSRTEQQAGALEETAATMEQLTAAVRQNSEHASHAHNLARDASAAAHQGGAVVGQVVQTMDAISAAARQITDIISVIDGIAFQTNILALNAAVEAARAGEQGRGFAVVATEVRNLAHRSAAAAKDIKQLIGATGTQVGLGVTLVQQAGDGMQAIVERIARVSEVMSEIVGAGQQQSSGISQVNEALAQMDQVTQQNAALVEEAAAASAAMQEQAAALVQAVSVFRLAPGAGAAGQASSTGFASRPKRGAPRPTLALAAA